MARGQSNHLEILSVPCIIFSFEVSIASDSIVESHMMMGRLSSNKAIDGGDYEEDNGLTSP
jgi:hypothetical protein